jgi:hypothetical protein
MLFLRCRPIIICYVRQAIWHAPLLSMAERRPLSGELLSSSEGLGQRLNAEGIGASPQQYRDFRSLAASGNYELCLPCHVGQKSCGNLRTSRKMARCAIDKKSDTGLTSAFVHKQKTA